MKILLCILSIINVPLIFCQDSEITFDLISKVELESHELKITNDSDSLLCVFFSGFHGRNGTTHFQLPAIDSSRNAVIYKLDFAKPDLTIDAQCKYFQVLTIPAHQSITITVDVLKNKKQKRIEYYFVKSDLPETKFLKKLPKRCLEYAFTFRQNSIFISND